MSSKSHQLPRLPVPRLRDTLDSYLKSLEPFLLEDEARGGPPAKEALRRRKEWADEFEKGLGKKCQERLIVLDKKSPFNWLDDNFWLYKAYLEWRAPLLINSNWWLAYHNDPNVPVSVLENQDTDKCAGITAWQIRRAAWILKRTLEFKERLASQTLYPDMTRTGLWIHNSVPRMFNVCRVPVEGRDRLLYPKPFSRHKNKIIVMIHDWMYVVDAYDHGAVNIGHEELERRIRGVTVDAERRLKSGEKAPPVAILTADHRDMWTNNRAHLLQLASSNHEIMNVMEDCLLILSLDHYTHVTTDPYPSEIKSHLHNIRSGINARNRWFDKGITLIVENNTRAGMMGEHSPVDALVPSIVADYSLSEDMDPDWSVPEPFESCEGTSVSSRVWERLDWVVDDFILQECCAAEMRAKSIIADSDDNVHWYTEYGSSWIKSFGQVSPDAYIQMALQLAWYRTRGTFTATYETALTRLFLHGRTETVRSLSTDSRRFVLAMCDSVTPPKVRMSLLMKALKTHRSLTIAATLGRGIDRHLTGLRLVLRGDEFSPLLDDPFFSKSQEWKLSTSGLSAGEYFRGTGFGSPYGDGYGINYLAGQDVIKFGIESKFSNGETSTELFKGAIFTSLDEMRDMFQCISLLPDKQVESRL